MMPSTAMDAPMMGPRDEALRLFEAHGAALYRFCRFTLGRADGADDVVQETFLKLLVHLENGGNRTNLRSWLFTVAANGCRDRTRRQWRWVPWRQELDMRIVEVVEPRPHLREVRQAMHALRPRDRLLLSLRAQGLSYRQIATAAGITETSVGRLLARAIARWKQQVESSKD